MLDTFLLLGITYDTSLTESKQSNRTNLIRSNQANILKPPGQGASPLDPFLTLGFGIVRHKLVGGAAFLLYLLYLGEYIPSIE